MKVKMEKWRFWQKMRHLVNLKSPRERIFTCCFKQKHLNCNLNSHSIHIHNKWSARVRKEKGREIAQIWVEKNSASLQHLKKWNEKGIKGILLTSQIEMAEEEEEVKCCT